MISHQNLLANFEQLMSGYFADSEGLPRRILTLVSWLPFYHDMGLVSGSLCTDSVGTSRLCSRARCRSCSARPGGCNCWPAILTPFSAAPNFAFELAARKISDDDMAGLDLGDVHTILSGSERVQPATLKRFADRFARFNLHGTGDPALVWARGSNGVRGDQQSGSTTRTRRLRLRETVRRPREAVRKRRRYTAGQLRLAAITDRADRRSRHPYRVSGGNGR